MKPMNLACPRCKEYFDNRNNSNDIDTKYLRCPHCRAEFHYHEFEKQVKRETQSKLNDYKNQRLLSDTPSVRTLNQNVTISFSEWIKWKLGYRKIEAIILLRSSVHQMIIECCRLYEFYPAIPRQLCDEQELRNFFVDPEHIFILNNITVLMKDADFLAEEFFRKGVLNRGEIRQIIDTELPHANWAGLTVTYNINKPEIRGFLLTIMMLKAQRTEMPKLFQNVQSWINEDGWNKQGLAISSNLTFNINN